MESQNFKQTDKNTYSTSTTRSYSKFVKLLEEGYINSVEYIRNNPAKILKVGSTAVVFSFMLGYVLGTKSISDNMLRSVNSTLSSIDRQNLKIISKLEEISTVQNSLDERIKILEQQYKSRFDLIENKIQIQKAVEEGQKRVEEVKKKNKWKKLLPWNWF